VERMLDDKLSRWNCPTPQQLGDFHIGLSSESEARTVVQHLDYCVRCRAEVAELRRFLTVESTSRQSPPITEPTRPHWRELVAILLPRTPVAGMRGADSGPLMAQADDLTIFLEVQ